MPAYYLAADLLSLLDLPDAHRLLAGSSPQWQRLMLQHFALQTLLDAEPHGQWPLAQAAGECAAELAKLSDGFAAEWQWLCGELSGKANTHWPALQQLAEQGESSPLPSACWQRLGLGRRRRGKRMGRVSGH